MIIAIGLYLIFFYLIYKYINVGCMFTKYVILSGLTVIFLILYLMYNISLKSNNTIRKYKKNSNNSSKSNNNKKQDNTQCNSCDDINNNNNNNNQDNSCNSNNNQDNRCNSNNNDQYNRCNDNNKQDNNKQDNSCNSNNNDQYNNKQDNSCNDNNKQDNSCNDNNNKQDNNDQDNSCNNNNKQNNNKQNNSCNSDNNNDQDNSCNDNNNNKQDNKIYELYKKHNKWIKYKTGNIYLDIIILPYENNIIESSINLYHKCSMVYYEFSIYCKISGKTQLEFKIPNLTLNINDYMTIATIIDKNMITYVRKTTLKYINNCIIISIMNDNKNMIISEETTMFIIFSICIDTINIPTPTIFIGNTKLPINDTIDINIPSIPCRNPISRFNSTDD